MTSADLILAPCSISADPTLSRSENNALQRMSVTGRLLERLGVVDFDVRINDRERRVRVFVTMRDGYKIDLDSRLDRGRVSVSRTVGTGINRREKGSPWRMETISSRRGLSFRDAFLSLAHAIEDYGTAPANMQLGARSYAKLLMRSAETHLKALGDTE